MISYFNTPKLYNIANEIIGRSQNGFGYQKIEIPHVALLFHYLRRHNVLVQYADNFVFERRRIIPYPQDIIDFSFYWDKTPQGHEFWRLIHEEWKKYIKKLSYIYERKSFRFNSSENLSKEWIKHLETNEKIIQAMYGGEAY